MLILFSRRLDPPELGTDFVCGAVRLKPPQHARGKDVEADGSIACPKGGRCAHRDCLAGSVNEWFVGHAVAGPACSGVGRNFLAGERANFRAGLGARRRPTNGPCIWGQSPPDLHVGAGGVAGHVAKGTALLRFRWGSEAVEECYAHSENQVLSEYMIEQEKQIVFSHSNAESKIISIATVFRMEHLQA